MTYEATKALERIVTVCEGSENLSRRQIRIFDIALEGLGFVSKQRAEIVRKWQQPHIEKEEARRARRDARLAEAQEQLEAA